MYSEKVIDHFSNPRNVGEIENADGVGTVGNSKCGDIMRMYLKVDDNGVITDCKFKTFGCGAAIATSSMATEMIKGKTLKEALKLTNKAVAEALDGLPPVKMHCGDLIALPASLSRSWRFTCRIYMAILKACAKARWQNCKLYMISPLNGMNTCPLSLLA